MRWPTDVRPLASGAHVHCMIGTGNGQWPMIGPGRSSVTVRLRHRALPGPCRHRHRHRHPSPDRGHWPVPSHYWPQSVTATLPCGLCDCGLWNVKYEPRCTHNTIVGEFLYVNVTERGVMHRHMPANVLSVSCRLWNFVHNEELDVRFCGSIWRDPSSSLISYDQSCGRMAHISSADITQSSHLSVIDSFTSRTPS